MSEGTLTESITRSLAYMLRHQPEEFDLELDDEGYGEMKDVLHALTERTGEEIEEDDVLEAIDSGGRKRYEVVDGRIRALYGHSFSTDPGEPSEPPEFLYVGVGSRDADRATDRGLRGGRRAFLHLALDFDEAQEMGRRIAPDYAVVTVRALDAWEDDVLFYDRHSLFLSEEIPTDYLEVGEIHTDGIRRERRGGGRSRGGPRGGDDRSSRVRGRRGRGPAMDESPEEPTTPSAPRAEPRTQRQPEPQPSGGAGGFGQGIEDDACPDHEPQLACEPETIDPAVEAPSVEPPVESHVEPAVESPAEPTGGSPGFGAGL